MRRKLSSIASTDLVSGALAMHGIRVTAKLGGVTYRVEPEDWSGSKRKARPEGST